MRKNKLAISSQSNTQTCDADNNSSNSNNPMVELIEHVQSMDCNEAYKRMCLAQDEIRRLQALEGVDQDDCDRHRAVQEKMLSTSLDNSLLQKDNSDHASQFGARTDVKGIIKENVRNSCCQRRKIHGSWLDNNKKEYESKVCSIEYLPNVKCYQITLLAQTPNGCIPQSKDELQFTMMPLPVDDCGKVDDDRLRICYYEANLYQLKQQGTQSVNNDQEERELLLSITLPITTTASGSTINPTARISLDTNSISIRIQFQQDFTTTTTASFDGSSLDLVDNLLDIDSMSSFSSNTTNIADLNYLSCRTCHNPIIEPPSSSSNNDQQQHYNSIIQSVLPLPVGYWDDISDYLICYDGQANVDFTSSTGTCAIPHTILEDDAIVVLHQDDVIKRDKKDKKRRGGVMVGVRGMKGYGEHSSGSSGGGTESSSKVWKDKSAIRGEDSQAITCANCCTTLGFVSESVDSNTFRLYKHLLDCGKPTTTNEEEGSSGNDNNVSRRSGSVSIFSKYTCGSFLAREMVRYAENDAIYTFIVGISDVDDWTRVHTSVPFVLIHMLSWDTPMATIIDNDGTTPPLHFQKVVKVIYEEVTSGTSKEQPANNNSDDSMEWTWRGTDFCCPPNNTAGSSGIDETSGTTKQTKASSIRIFFSKKEWTELRDTLVKRSIYFSDVVTDAVVMTKLGLSSTSNDDKEHNAALSFLTLAH